MVSTYDGLLEQSGLLGFTIFGNIDRKAILIFEVLIFHFSRHLNFKKDEKFADFNLN
jgi:hypothetical protein